MAAKVYTKEELYDSGNQRFFKGDAQEAAFLIGGIGTGTISLGARGDLRDWEIFNKPAKGNKVPYSFFAIWVKPEGEGAVARVLEAGINPPYSCGIGMQPRQSQGGLPRLDSSVLKVEYPFANIDFNDEMLPVKVSLEAFNPFIPLNADDSGIPAAVLRYKVKNPTDRSADVTVAGSMMNVIGQGLGYEIRNELKNEYGLSGLYFVSTNMPADHLQYGNMALMTTDSDITVKREWLTSGFAGWDCLPDFWDDFSKDGKLEIESTCKDKWAIKNPSIKVGTLGVRHTLKPGEEKVFEFIISWYFPNRIKAWFEKDCKTDSCCCGTEFEKNYYSNLFSSSWDAGKYLIHNMARLEKASKDFARALHDSTLPGYVIDAMASNITVIRSNTCFRIANGTFLGWEGCKDDEGCCDGSCTHVWNYAQTLAFLFPELEQTMRKVEFGLETDEEGKMSFRTRRVFGLDPLNTAAADGQMGSIIRLYREWKLSGNNDLIKNMWNKVKRALNYVFGHWDTDGDYVMDSSQHNTYDIDFIGPNSLTNSMLYGALKAAVEMAKFMEDDEAVKKYAEALDKGSKKMDEMLWNGEYYIQKIDDVDEHRYQYGEGCLSDQILGQFLCHVAGLGYILPEDHVKKAIKSVFDYNFRPSFKGHVNPLRAYVFNDEKGLLICSWPKGGMPHIPFLYAGEVWTGIEYQVAAHLIYEGFIEEGLTIVKAVRDRHDGYKRNPWDEVECGHHYARAMSSWALLTALSGFKYDMVNGTMSFRPAINQDDFSCFWSTGKGWGIYRQKINPQTKEVEWDIEVLYGNIDGIAVNS